MFSFAFAANSLSSYGAKRSEYEKSSLEVVTSLSQLREEQVVDYLRESELIEVLREIESRKNNSSGDLALDLTNKGVKAFVPVPGVGIASELVSSTARRYVRGDQKDLVQGTLESIVDVAGKEVMKEAISETTEIATNLIGTAAIGLAVANAPIIAATTLLGGSIVLAANSSMREKCWGWISNAAKGTAEFIKEGFSKVFHFEGSNELILKSYDLYSKKSVKLIKLQEAKVSKETDSKNATGRLTSYQLSLKTTESKFEDRRKSWFGRFVFHLNHPGLFYGLLTSLFCLISNRFKMEKMAQDALNTEISTLKITIEHQGFALRRLSGEINSLASRIFSCIQVKKEREQTYLENLPAAN
ncbi:MAG: hypothetical protein ACHQUC_03240 [Chlamydiales bacterium]